MEKKISMSIDDRYGGRSVRDVLRMEMNLSSAIIKSLKRTDDGIVVNGERAFTNRKLMSGDVIELTIRDEKSDNIVPQDIPLSVLYEDDDVIALNKPRGMPTHPSQNHYIDTLANGLTHYFRGKAFTFRAITRLDRDTSGIVLVAKNHFSAQLLGEAMKNKLIKKEYVAIVNGVPNPRSGCIDKPIKRQRESVMLRCVAPDGKTAVTEYKTEMELGKYSFVRLCPLTGRTHQLRVHLSSIGNPIYGDDMYGAPQCGETRLHCRLLEFIHPQSGEKICITAPMPDDMKEFYE